MRLLQLRRILNSRSQRSALELVVQELDIWIELTVERLVKIGIVLLEFDCFMECSEGWKYLDWSVAEMFADIEPAAEEYCPSSNSCAQQLRLEVRQVEVADYL
ncbi:hypothetical protein L1887_32294 [Cichorium endivia]|nr:hypothetical protein L1887_32294 [Cichorium endivia]